MLARRGAKAQGERAAPMAPGTDVARIETQAIVGRRFEDVGGSTARMRDVSPDGRPCLAAEASAARAREIEWRYQTWMSVRDNIEHRRA